MALLPGVSDGIQLNSSSARLWESEEVVKYRKQKKNNGSANKIMLIEIEMSMITLILLSGLGSH